VADALSLYERLLPSDPSGFDLNHLAGLACYQLGRLDRALALLGTARRLNPRAASTVMLLGLVAKGQGQLERAEDLLREAIRLSPGSAESWSNLGALLIVRDKEEEAAECFRKAVKLDPKDPAAWGKLGSVSKRLGRHEEALASLDRALALNPKDPLARRARAEVLQATSHTEEALAELDRHLSLFPDDLPARSARLMLLHYFSSVTTAQLADEHFDYGRRASAQQKGRQSGARGETRRAGEGRLRVGFLSADFRRHSVAYFILPLLSHLDHNRFELFAYYDHFSKDATTEGFQRLIPNWRNVFSLEADAFTELVRSDALDVLIDLGGHTQINRLPLFERRLAPVQLSYLGYPNTTGLPSMDYRFVDPVSDPLGEEDAHYSEKRIRFSTCAWCYQAPFDAPAPAPRASEEPFCFGSFNLFAKLSPLTLSLWRRILEGAPGSLLVLKGIAADHAYWREKLVAAGIGSDRVRLLPHCESMYDHLACYQGLDLALDPFPYNGTTTTCEALWMGVPVLTLAGDRHASRVGASLLQAVGLPDFVATDPDGYVARAVQLAGDRPRLAELRSSLRERMRTSILCDAPAQARRFGDALLSISTQTGGSITA